MTPHLHILPTAVTTALAAVVFGCLWHDWQAGFLRQRDAAWGLSVLAVLLASALVSGWAFLSAAGAVS